MGSVRCQTPTPARGVKHRSGRTVACYQTKYLSVSADSGKTPHDAMWDSLRGKIYPLPIARYFHVIGHPSLAAMPVLLHIHPSARNGDQFIFSLFGHRCCLDGNRGSADCGSRLHKSMVLAFSSVRQFPNAASFSCFQPDHIPDELPLLVGNHLFDDSGHQLVMLS